MKTTLLFFFTLIWTISFGQTKADVENLIKIPKKYFGIEISHKIALPRPNGKFWDKDYASYKHFITPAMSRTQLGMAFSKDGIETWMISNSVIPHAQLDTSTIINNAQNLIGTWRMITHRNIRFTDSVTYVNKEVYRSDTVLNDISKTEDVFAFFTDNHLKIYSKEVEKTKIKLKNSTTYRLENGRSIMLFKFIKSSGVVGQIGIDENGLLIMNFPAVVEYKKPNEYIVYNTIIEQMIFEKIR